MLKNRSDDLTEFECLPCSSEFSDRPSYLPEDIEDNLILRSLREESKYWSTGKGQRLSKESAKALMHSEALMLDLCQSDTLRYMGMDPNLSGSQSLKGHCIRVAVLSLLINDKLKEFSSFAVANTGTLATAALFHDIGKMKPEINQIIMSPRKIKKDDPEFEIIKRHTEYGAELALAMPSTDSPKKRIAIAEAIFQHHERNDGTGYHGTPGSKITPEAAIIAVADVIDAMGEPRSYKGPIETPGVMRELKKCRQQFNEEILRIICKIRSISGVFVRHIKSDRP